MNNLLSGLYLSIVFITVLYNIDILDKLKWPRLVKVFVPIWRFFAPIPGTINHHLLYRTKWNTISVWQEDIYLQDISKFTYLFGWLWNPYSRNKKVLFDIISMLPQKNDSSLKYSTPYLLLLNYLSQKLDPSQTDAFTQLQFLILARHNDENPKLLLLSEYHHIS